MVHSCDKNISDPIASRDRTIAALEAMIEEKDARLDACRSKNAVAVALVDYQRELILSIFDQSRT